MAESDIHLNQCRTCGSFYWTYRGERCTNCNCDNKTCRYLIPDEDDRTESGLIAED